MSVLVEFSMFPTDKGESVSVYVSKIIKFFEDNLITYQLTPMGTIIETETLNESLKLINQCYELLEPDCNRVYCSANFDIRKFQSNRMTKKINSVLEKVKKIKQHTT